MTNTEIREKIMAGAKAEIDSWRTFASDLYWWRGASRSEKAFKGGCISDARAGISRYLVREWFGGLTGAERKQIQRELEAMQRDGLIQRLGDGRTSHIQLLKTDTNNTNKLTAGVTGKESV